MNGIGQFGFMASRVERLGDGYFAGEAPAAPGDPDGLAKLDDVPSKVRIVVYERARLNLVVEATLSAADGTWRIENLDRTIDYFVIGFDDRGTQNAAIQDWVRPAPM